MLTSDSKRVVCFRADWKHIVGKEEKNTKISRNQTTVNTIFTTATNFLHQHCWEETQHQQHTNTNIINRGLSALAEDFLRLHFLPYCLRGLQRRSTVVRLRPCTTRVPPPPHPPPRSRLHAPVLSLDVALALLVLSFVGFDVVYQCTPHQVSGQAAANTHVTKDGT